MTEKETKIANLNKAGYVFDLAAKDTGFSIKMCAVYRGSIDGRGHWCCEPGLFDTSVV